MWDFLTWLPFTAFIAAGLFILGAIIAVRREPMDSHAPVVFPLVIGAIFAGFAGWNLMVQVPATSALRAYTGLEDAYVKCDSWFTFLADGGSNRTLGFVKFDSVEGISSRVRLPSKTCNELRTFLISGATEVSEDTVWGVGVLTHEAEHVRGVLNEAKAQCNATQRVDEMAAHLGAPAYVSEQFPALVEAVVNPWLPPEYQSFECVENGAFDRTPGDNSWP